MAWLAWLRSCRPDPAQLWDDFINRMCSASLCVHLRVFSRRLRRCNNLTFILAVVYFSAYTGRRQTGRESFGISKPGDVYSNAMSTHHLASPGAPEHVKTLCLLSFQSQWVKRGISSKYTLRTTRTGVCTDRDRWGSLLWRLWGNSSVEALLYNPGLGAECWYVGSTVNNTRVNSTPMLGVLDRLSGCRVLQLAPAEAISVDALFAVEQESSILWCTPSPTGLLVASAGRGNKPWARWPGSTLAQLNGRRICRMTLTL